LIDPTKVSLARYNIQHTALLQPFNNFTMPTLHNIETLYEMCDLEQTTFESAVDELITVGLMQEEITADGVTYYKSRQGLSWSDVVHIDSPAKKEILLCLIDNPKTFFVIYNTQKGKLRIAATEIRSWASVSDKQVVAFLMVDNDKTLADHSADGLFDVIGPVGRKFLLSSSTSDNIDTIKAHIDAYAAYGDRPMPVIVFLNNTKQIAKVQSLMQHIRDRMMTERGRGLRYGIVFDEADKVYPPCRARFAKFLVDDERALYRLGFVTATEGDLLDADYPECANAYMYPVPIGDPGYRAFHTEDAVIEINVHKVKDNNDAYAEMILDANRDHFNETVKLRNGTQGFRKTIVNSSAKCSSMAEFAKRRNAGGAYAVTVNMNGICVYRPGHEMKKYSSKGKKFGRLLFGVYTELGLHDKPLYCIGRRKVDRGLGFHWAPRDGGDGLIWTDMILGRIGDKNNASQKAGRLAGVVEQCPQYPGKLTWWTDRSTADLIIRHNKLVDSAAENRGCSILQAITRASVAVPMPVPAGSPHKLSQIFDSVALAKEWSLASLTVGASVLGLFNEAGNTRGLSTATHYADYYGENGHRGVILTCAAEGVHVADADQERIRRGVSHTGAKSRVMPVSINGVNKCVVVFMDDHVKRA
jgi:hypothetical protein